MKIRNTENKICLNVPFFHAFGLTMANLLIFHTGSTLVMEERSFNPIKTLKAIAQEKCAITYGTPTMWVSKNRRQGKLDLFENFPFYSVDKSKSHDNRSIYR